MGTMGESIPTDIIHILNPDPHHDTPSSDLETTGAVIAASSTASRRRRHSHHHHHHHPIPTASTSSTQHTHQPGHNRSHSLSTLETEQQQKLIRHNSSSSPLPNKPQVWIRVPEPDLTTVWTALSGFSTSLDTGNYGVIDAGIRVVRASRYLTATTGPLRNKW